MKPYMLRDAIAVRQPAADAVVRIEKGLYTGLLIESSEPAVIVCQNPADSSIWLGNFQYAVDIPPENTAHQPPAHTAVGHHRHIPPGIPKNAVQGILKPLCAPGKGFPSRRRDRADGTSPLFIELRVPAADFSEFHVLPFTCIQLHQALFHMHPLLLSCNILRGFHTPGQRTGINSFHTAALKPGSQFHALLPPSDTQCEIRMSKTSAHMPGPFRFPVPYKVYRPHMPPHFDASPILNRSSDLVLCFQCSTDAFKLQYKAARKAIFFNYRYLIS